MKKSNLTVIQLGFFNFLAFLILVVLDQSREQTLLPGTKCIPHVLSLTLPEVTTTMVSFVLSACLLGSLPRQGGDYTSCQWLQSKGNWKIAMKVKLFWFTVDVMACLEGGRCFIRLILGWWSKAWIGAHWVVLKGIVIFCVCVDCMYNIYIYILVYTFGKLTLAGWNIPIFHRKYIFKGSIFHCLC